MEGYTRGGLVYQASGDYPPLQVLARDRRYAEAMLDNIGGSNSEMSAVASYFYNHLVTAECPEVAEAFHYISIVEMHHLEIFGTLARQLGEDPRLWGCHQGRRSWWTPGCLSYQRPLASLLHNAVRAEKAAIRKYRAQLRWIGDPCIVENLRRIVADEEQHLAVLTILYDTYVPPNTSRF